jgi:hypothetical protein
MSLNNHTKKRKKITQRKKETKGKKITQIRNIKESSLPTSKKVQPSRGHKEELMK